MFLRGQKSKNLYVNFAIFFFGGGEKWGRASDGGEGGKCPLLPPGNKPNHFLRQHEKFMAFLDSAKHVLSIIDYSFKIPKIIVK